MLNYARQQPVIMLISIREPESTGATIGFRNYPHGKLQSCVMLAVLKDATDTNNHNYHINMHSNSDRMDPGNWLDAHGDYLFRFAMKLLRNTAQAEDAVQDTLLAALQAVDKYTGEASQRTWLTGILKHKVIDIIRKQSRETTYSSADSPDQAEMLDTHLFDERGEWTIPQSNWGNPVAALEQERFWDAFMACLDGLPPKLAQIFSLRELSGFDTAELCEALNITSSNAWVILHRARLALKVCLETTWLQNSAGRDVPCSS